MTVSAKQASRRFASLPRRAPQKSSDSSDSDRQVPEALLESDSDSSDGSESDTDDEASTSGSESEPTVHTPHQATNSSLNRNDPLLGKSSSTTGTPGLSKSTMAPAKPKALVVDEELGMLRPSGSSAAFGTLNIDDKSSNAHEMATAPLVTGDAIAQLPGVFPQKSLFGGIISQHSAGFPETTQSPKLYVNINAPFSTVICGVQGSGKSHTAAVLLENCLISDRKTGVLQKSLAGLVMHYDTAAGGAAVLPCEAAYLSALKGGNKSVPGVPVTVLVSPTNLQGMSAVYQHLPHVTVLPLHLSTSNLNSARMLSLMGCDDTARMPLYMYSALSILREMGADGFSYSLFKSKLEAQDLNPAQRAGIKIRTDMLDSYLKGTPKSNVTKHFASGTLVVLDLTDPFTDAQSAAILFDIVLALFVEADIKGKVVLLDEAHKYLSTNYGSSRLTNSILSLIRQQRHLGIRTLIATQEPTVVPSAILDLTSFLVLHRFSSPAWCNHLDKHVSLSVKGDEEQGKPGWLAKVVALRTGEALVFSPGAVSVLEQGKGGENGAKRSEGMAKPFGTGFMKIYTRKRLTLDGGASMMVV